MPDLGQTQLRLVYSLLKPAVAMAARFHVPMRTLSELLRLAYFEVLRRQGHSQTVVGERLGQSARHMRTLENRLKSDFFAAESEIGLVREVESQIAKGNPTLKQLRRALSGWSADDIDRAVETLVTEGRVIDEDGTLSMAPKYVILGSDKFHHRIDALNHFLSGASLAVAQRLIFEERDKAMLKTISFVVRPSQVKGFLASLEANLRRDIAALEEEAHFEGEEHRYVLGLFAAQDADSKV